MQVEAASASAASSARTPQRYGLSVSRRSCVAIAITVSALTYASTPTLESASQKEASEESGLSRHQRQKGPIATEQLNQISAFNRVKARHGDLGRDDIQALMAPCGSPAIPPCWHVDAADTPTPQNQADLVETLHSQCPTALLRRIQSAASSEPPLASAATPASWDRLCEKQSRQSTQPGVSGPKEPTAPSILKSRYQDKAAVKELVRSWIPDDELVIAKTYHVIRDHLAITVDMVAALYVRLTHVCAAAPFCPPLGSYII